MSKKRSRRRGQPQPQISDEELINQIKIKINEMHHLFNQLNMNRVSYNDFDQFCAVKSAVNPDPDYWFRG